MDLAITVHLFGIQPETQIELEVPREFPFVLDIMTQHLCGCVGMKLEIANTRTEPHQEWIVEGFIGSDGARRSDHQSGRQSGCGVVQDRCRRRRWANDLA